MTAQELEQKGTGLLSTAETAWLAGDLAASTKALAAKSGCATNFVRESHLEANTLPPGVSLEPLLHQGRPLSSQLVRMETGIAGFDIGVPLLGDGTFYSHAFAHLKYPERYAHLFGETAGQALQTAAQSAHYVADAYVTLIRPPYYHWLLDTVPHLYGASHLGHVDQIKLLAPDSMVFQPWQRSLLEKAVSAFGIGNLAYLPTNGTAVGMRPGFSQTHMPLKERLSLLRLIAPPATAKKPERFLYARRGKGDVRHLHNEDAVITALGDKFTVIEPGELDLDTQMTLFSEARCVVGVHGSNLSNIAFCQPDTVVVEIAAGLLQPHFEKLSKVAGLKFVRVDAKAAADDSAEKTWAQAHGDLVADPLAVIRAVEQGLDAATNPLTNP